MKEERTDNKKGKIMEEIEAKYMKEEIMQLNEGKEEAIQFYSHI
jgi:hypothetical protein